MTEQDLTEQDLTELLRIVARCRSQETSARAAEKAIFACVAKGRQLPVVPHPGTGEPTQYEVVQRVGRKRVWRSEAEVKKLLGVLGYQEARNPRNEGCASDISRCK